MSNNILKLLKQLEARNKPVRRNSSYKPPTVAQIDIDRIPKKRLAAIVEILKSNKRKDVICPKILKEYGITEPLVKFAERSMSSAEQYPEDVLASEGLMRRILNVYEHGLGDKVAARTMFNRHEEFPLSDWINSFSWVDYAVEDNHYSWVRLYKGITGRNKEQKIVQPLRLILSILACDDLETATADLEDLLCPQL